MQEDKARVGVRAISIKVLLPALLAVAVVVVVSQTGSASPTRPGVSAALGSRVVRVNKTLHVTGRVRDLGKRPQITLQRHVGRSWKRVAGSMAARRSEGRYVVRWRPSKTGVVRVRVRVTGAGRVATSRSIRLRVSATLGGTPSGGNYGVGNWPPAGWRPFAGSSPFYTSLPSSPRLVPNSSAIVSKLFSSAQSTAAPEIAVSTRGKQGGTPTYFSQPSDPVFTIHCTRSSYGHCGVEGSKVRIPSGARPEGGVASNGTDDSTDSHMTIIDQPGGMAYDFWQVQRSAIPSTGGRLDISYGGRFPLSGGGISATGGGGSNASDFSDIVGRSRIEDIQAGEIAHAINIVINCDDGHAVYPASGTGSTCSSPTNAPPMGTRFQLDYSDAQIDALNAPEHRKVLYRAMAHYGLIVGDTGSDRLFSMELDSDYTYNSFGAPSRWLDFARTSDGWKNNGGEFDSDLGADGVNWHRLRVIAPCVSQGSC